MDLATVDNVSDDSSSTNSFVEISSGFTDFSDELDLEVEVFYSYPIGKSRDEKGISYEELLEKELKKTRSKLQESEKEFEKLKSEAQKKESELELALNIALETAQRRVVHLETDLSDSNSKFDSLKKEFQVIVGDQWVQISDLNGMLNDCKTSYANVIRNQQTDIARLLANRTYLESVVRDMEDQIDNSDAEKLELQHEINALKTDLLNRDERIDALVKHILKL